MQAGSTRFFVLSFFAKKKAFFFFAHDDLTHPLILPPSFPLTECSFLVSFGQKSAKWKVSVARAFLVRFSSRMRQIEADALLYLLA